MLITDYQMPGMDGIALAKHVRRLCSRTTIIMITAYNGDALHEQIDDACIQRVLDKPARLRDIRSAVSGVFQLVSDFEQQKIYEGQNDEGEQIDPQIPLVKLC